MVYIHPKNPHAGQSDAIDPEPEEVLLELQVENLLAFDLDGYLLDEELYLPLEELLSHLKIPNQFSDSQKAVPC